MFQSARLKLTAWYLLFIMSISLFFSVAFYNVATREIQRLIHRLEVVQQRQEDGFVLIPPPPISPFNIQELQEAELRLKVLLILINMGIFVVAGGAGYFLAGRTLRPIKEMVDEQNRFITDSSHELRTPLTALRSEMEASLLGKNMTAHDVKKLIQSNLEEVINLQVLSDNLLQLAQYQKPNGNQLFKTVSLQEVIEDSLKKVVPLAKKKYITIKNDAKDYSLEGDKYSLSQLLVILLDNAIKYSSQKTIITLSSAKTDHHVKISITDQGIGINQKDIQNIFERFYRADMSRTKKTAAGYGLGLSIAKKIVETHKGTINVVSEEAKGTTFIVQLPVK